MDPVALADAFVAVMQWLALGWLGAGAALSLRESVLHGTSPLRVGGPRSALNCREEIEVRCATKLQ